MSNKSFIGVFLNPYFVQSEGLDAVFDRLESMGTTAVATHSRIGRPVGDNEGVRFPDLHGDGHRRVLARNLWGSRALQIETAESFMHDPAFYGQNPYAPEPEPVPDWEGADAPMAIVREAKARGMEVHLMTHPFLHGDLREEDVPVYVDGHRPAEKRFSGNMCLNSPVAREFALAKVAELVHFFPDIDGIMPDWVEFGAYKLEDVFTCFCPHCEAEALRHGFDWELVCRDTLAAWDWLHALAPATVERLAGPEGDDALDRALKNKPGLREFVRFKANAVSRFYRDLRQFLTDRGRENITITSRGWPPPWNAASGMNYGLNAEFCEVAAPKLFTFDYCAIPRWYGEVLSKWNPLLGESAILDMLVRTLNLPDAIEGRRFEHYYIPAPDELHLAGIECYGPRIEKVIAAVPGERKVRPFTHAYLPLPQWREMLHLMKDLPVDGIWIQMFGYLSDEKMQAVGEIWNQGLTERNHSRSS